MEQISCIFCHQNESVPEQLDDVVIEENSFLARKCPSCHLIYVSPRPSINEVVNLYADGEADISPQDHIDAAFLKRLYARNNLAVLKPYCNSGSLLDIGAGGGAFLNEARQQGFDVYGIELNKLQAEYIENELSIPCETKPISDAFARQKFDAVYHCDVISHFYDPWYEFKAINEKIVLDGYMLFETGCGGDVEYKYYKEIDKFQLPDHLFFFSEKNIRDLLTGTGFELKKIVKYSTLPQHRTTRRVNALVRKLRGSSARTNQNNLPSVDETSMVQSNAENASDTRPAVVQTSVGKLKKQARQLWHIWTYILRYKIGYFTLKSGRPQTMVIVAQKVKDMPNETPDNALLSVHGQAK